MAIRKYGRIWHIYWQEQGRLRSFSTGSTDRLEALKIDSVFKAQRRAKRARARILNFLGPEAKTILQQQEQETREAQKIPEQKQEQDSMLLSSMLPYAEKNRDISTSIKRIWNRFIHWCDSHKLKYASDVTPQVALQFLSSAYDKKSSNGKTFNNARSALNTVFKQCLVRANLHESPINTIPYRQVSDVQHHRPLTEDEFRRVWNLCDTRMKTLALVGWHTGARLETAARITRELLESEIKDTTIIPSKTSRFGNKAVFVPFHRELLAWIQHVKQTVPKQEWQAWNFNKRKGKKRISEFVLLLRQAGIEDNDIGTASFASLRDSFITRCDENKISRQATKGIVGHRSDKMTDLYSYDKKTALEILALPPSGVFDEKTTKETTKESKGTPKVRKYKSM